MLLYLIFSYCLISSSAKDISMESISGTGRIQTTIRVLANSGYWSVKVNKLIPPGKFLRLTISYKLDGKKEKVSFIVNGKSPHLRLNGIAVYLTTLGDYPPTLFIVGLAGVGFSPRWVYKKRLLKNAGKIVSLYVERNLSFDLEQETVIARTFSTAPNMKPGKYKRWGSTVIIPPPAVKIELKAESKLVDSPEIFLLTKDLRPNLTGLSLRQQYIFLYREVERREKLYRRRQATINDMNVACMYRALIRDKLEAAGMKIPTRAEVFKAKR